jgi:MHS family alpha-ketoglutarate permease-like MFS transporter
VGGHVLAQVTLLIQQSVLTDEQIASFGWRIAFGIGALGAVVVLFLRRSMDESLQTEVDGKRSGSMTELFTAYPKQLLICFLVTLGGTVAFYTYSVNGPLIVKSTYADQGMTATWINLAALVLLMVIQPLGGLLSDKIGRKPLLVGFGIAGVLWSWTFLNLLPRVETPMVSFLLLAGTYVILTGYTSINAIVKAELFPAHVRALGLGLGYALANSMFGGTAPVIYEAAKENDALDAFGIYVTIAIAVSLVVYVFVLKNRAPTFLDAEQARRADRNEAAVS